MKFNVFDLLREGYGAFREYDLDEEVRVDGEPHALSGHARFDRTPRGVLVRARLRGIQRAVCSRCLRDMAYPVQIEIEEQYVPTFDPLSGARVALEEGEEDAYRIDERHVIDLTPPVQHYWSMALEMAPVCREDCPGLCAHCGAELTPGHRCESEPVDERWAKLRELRQR